jgi:hypothetical protein
MNRKYQCYFACPSPTGYVYDEQGNRMKTEEDGSLVVDGCDLSECEKFGGGFCELHRISEDENEGK